MTSGTYEVYPDTKGGFRYRMKSLRNETIMVSEGFNSKEQCVKAVEQLKTYNPKTIRHKLKVTKDHRCYFKLVAPRHGIIGTSEPYNTVHDCKMSMSFVLLSTPSALIKECSL